MYICPYCQGTGATISMVAGFPGYFVADQCRNACSMPKSCCITCLSIGRAVCLEHSLVEFRTMITDHTRVAVHRAPPPSNPSSIVDICGEIVDYIRSLKGIRLDP